MRAKREIETPDYAKMLTRMMRSYGERVAEADPEDLADMLAVREALDAAIAVAVARQRTRYSWALIGSGIGMSKQAAQQRFSKVIAGVIQPGCVDRHSAA